MKIARHRLAARALLAAALLSLAGCASVQVERAKDLSTAGLAYSRATTSVIDLAMNAVVDASSERQIRRGLPQAATPAEAAQREQSLTELDAELVKNLQLYLQLKRSVGAVEAYFAGLQALAGATPGPATEASVKSLVDHVNGVNAALESAHRIPDDRRNAIAGLAGLLVKQAHGAALGRALERDAEVIGRALVLQELALRAAVSDIVGAMNDADARFYRDRVIRPYVAGNVGGGWASDRRDALRARALGTTPQVVAGAAAAARQMQAVWGRILAGESSGEEFNLMLRDVRELLDAAIAVKKTT